MVVKRFGLGFRIPSENVNTMGGEESCMELLVKGIKPKNISGLTMKWGYDGDIFVIVIMGGGLGQSRRLYRDVLANREFFDLLEKDMPVIEINRLMKLTEFETERSF